MSCLSHTSLLAIVSSPLFLCKGRSHCIFHSWMISSTGLNLNGKKRDLLIVMYLKIVGERQRISATATICSEESFCRWGAVPLFDKIFLDIRVPDTVLSESVLISRQQHCYFPGINIHASFPASGSADPVEGSSRRCLWRWQSAGHGWHRAVPSGLGVPQLRGGGWPEGDTGETCGSQEHLALERWPSHWEPAGPWEVMVSPVYQ